MAVTIQNYRIIPYAQKDALPKVIFGGTWGITITLPTAHESGDGYILALDYERVVYPLARPVCAYSNEFSIDGDALTMAVSLDTLRLAKWVSSIRKPTPICVQIVRVRGEIYETLLLDEILALPSVANGDAYADPHSPIMDTLAEYVGDGVTTIRQGGVVKGVINANQKTNNVIDLDAGGGGGSMEQATDAEIDERESNTHAITPNNLNYAVTAALTDQNHITLTAEQQATAQEVLGVPAPIIGNTAPTTATVGKLMQQYLDETTGKTYHCTAITNTGTEAEPVWSYTWTDDINSKGGTFTGNISTQGHITATYATVTSIMYGLEATEARYPRSFAFGKSSRALWFDQFVIGTDLSVGGTSRGNNLLLLGKNNKPLNDLDNSFARITGGGTSDNNRLNIEELSWAGDHYIAGGHQQGITVIPSATTAYTLAEGQQSHIPDSASTYTLPAVTDSTRTHEIILTIRFSASVLTYAFEDAQGNTLTPLPLAGTIADGSVVAFRCTWEALLNQWVIMPVMLGTYEEAEP